MTLVVCSFCLKTFNMPTEREKHGYGTHRCSHCGRTVLSSRREEREGINANKQFIHSDFRKGDRV